MTAVARQLPGPFWFSHGSAALLHELPLLHLPGTTHLTQAQRASGRSDPTISRHSRPLPAAQTTVVDRLPVTSLARTALDCAMTLPDLDALTVLDRAVAAPGVAATLEDLLAAVRGASGTARARWCLEHANPLAE